MVRRVGGHDGGRVRICVAVLALATLGGAVPASAEPASFDKIRLLPATTFGDPPRLAVGPYRTRPGFVPATTFRVDAGWYGSGDREGWGVGKGLNTIEQRFGVAGIYATPLSLRYATAVSRFKALKTLVAGPATTTRIGGYPAVTFRATVTGDHALLPGIAPGVDVVNTRGQQTFVNVRGTTVLIRTEVFRATAGEAAVRSLVRTIGFPR